MVKKENTMEIDLVKIIMRVKRYWRLSLCVFTIVVFVGLALTLTVFKTYEANSLIYLGVLESPVYSTSEAKNIILSNDISGSARDKFIGKDISFEEFLDDHVEVDPIIELISFTENREVQQIRLKTRARDAELAYEINKEISEKFVNHGQNVLDQLTELRNGQLVEVNNNIDRVTGGIEEVNLEIESLKNLSGGLEISRILILRNVMTNLEFNLSEYQDKKSKIEESLVRKIDFEIASPPEVPKNPKYLNLGLNLVIFLLVGILSVLLVTTVRDQK